MRTIVPLLALLITGRVALAAEAVSFPGHDQAIAPQGRYAIVYRELYPTPGPNHQILLKDLQTGSGTPLLSFDRHADVLWAPDGDCVAITDWVGSNVSELFLVFPARSAKRVDLQEETHRSGLRFVE